jgi:hypothetical protein
MAGGGDFVTSTSVQSRSVVDEARSAEPELIVGPDLEIGPDTVIGTRLGRQLHLPRPIVDGAAATDVVARAELILVRAVADLAAAIDQVGTGYGPRPWRVGDARRLDDRHATARRLDDVHAGPARIV